MSSADAYTLGFYTGTLIYFGVLALVFWFVGRWGWIGMIIRAACVGLAIFRIVALLSPR